MIAGGRAFLKESAVRPPSMRTVKPLSKVVVLPLRAWLSPRANTWKEELG